MGNKKRAKKPTAKNGAPQQHAGDSFQTLAQKAIMEKVAPFIQQQMQVIQFQIQGEMQNTLRGMYTRITVMEEVMMDKLGITEEEYVDMVIEKEDTSDGLEKVEDGAVEAGDRVRITVMTKTKEQEEFAGESKLVLDNCGVAPFQIGEELEPQVVGMALGETKDFPFGKDKEMVAKITIDRIARRPKLEEVKDESEDAGE
jgi:hypothetical protein